MEIRLADMDGGEHGYLVLRDTFGSGPVRVVLTRMDADILRQLLTEWLDDSRDDEDADGREGCGHAQPW